MIKARDNFYVRGSIVRCVYEATHQYEKRTAVAKKAIAEGKTWIVETDNHSIWVTESDARAMIEALK